MAAELIARQIFHLPHYISKNLKPEDLQLVKQVVSVLLEPGPGKVFNIPCKKTYDNVFLSVFEARRFMRSKPMYSEYQVIFRIHEMVKAPGERPSREEYFKVLLINQNTGKTKWLQVFHIKKPKKQSDGSK